MAGTWVKGDPTGLQVRKMLPHPGTGAGTSTATATGTITAGMITVRVPVAASTTGNYWSNPELGTVMAQSHMVWVTAGTGTFDIGVSSDGTSGTDDIINGGTMLAGVYSNGTVSATSVLGVINNAWQLVGPAGTGTRNTVTVIHNESTTGTAVGFIVVQYITIQ